MRQFIDPARPQPGSDARDAAVLRTRPACDAVGFRIDRHAAELQHGENAAVLTNPLLAVKNGCPNAVLELDRDGREKHQRPGDCQQQETGRHVEKPAGEVAGP